MYELRHGKPLTATQPGYLLMHGAEVGKGVSCGKAAHGKVCQVFFEVSKSRRQG